MQSGVTVSGNSVSPKRIFPSKSVVSLTSASTASCHFATLPTIAVIEQERSSTSKTFGAIGAIASSVCAQPPPGSHAVEPRLQARPSPQSASSAQVPSGMHVPAALQNVPASHADLQPPNCSPPAPVPPPTAEVDWPALAPPAPGRSGTSPPHPSSDVARVDRSEAASAIAALAPRNEGRMTGVYDRPLAGRRISRPLVS